MSEVFLLAVDKQTACIARCVFPPTPQPPLLPEQVYTMRSSESALVMTS